jgi:hypothetical protein
MKSNLEKEIDRICEGYHWFESLSDSDVREIIKKIAAFQKNDTVNEICEWLKEYCVPILSDACVADLIEDLKERFK